MEVLKREVEEKEAVEVIAFKCINLILSATQVNTLEERHRYVESARNKLLELIREVIVESNSYGEKQ